MIYDNIIEIISSKNLTVHALEMRAGLANGTIRKWNSPDANPQISNLIAVADALGVSVNRLLRHTEEKSNVRA